MLLTSLGSSGQGPGKADPESMAWPYRDMGLSAHLHVLLFLREAACFH